MENNFEFNDWQAGDEVLEQEPVKPKEEENELRSILSSINRLKQKMVKPEEKSDTNVEAKADILNEVKAMVSTEKEEKGPNDDFSDSFVAFEDIKLGENNESVNSGETIETAGTSDKDSLNEPIFVSDSIEPLTTYDGVFEVKETANEGIDGKPETVVETEKISEEKPQDLEAPLLVQNDLWAFKETKRKEKKEKPVKNKIKVEVDKRGRKQVVSSLVLSILGVLSLFIPLSIDGKIKWTFLNLNSGVVAYGKFFDFLYNEQIFKIVSLVLMIGYAAFFGCCLVTLILDILRLKLGSEKFVKIYGGVAVLQRIVLWLSLVFISLNLSGALLEILLAVDLKLFNIKSLIGAGAMILQIVLAIVLAKIKGVYRKKLKEEN